MSMDINPKKMPQILEYLVNKKQNAVGSNKWNLSLHSAFYVLTYMFCSCQNAYADWHVAAMQCDREQNKLLIRFGMNGGHYAEIPSTLAKEWTIVPTFEDTAGSTANCKFNDGQNISVSISTSAEISTASGGGDVSGYFSLCLNGKLLFNNTRFYQGQNLSLYDISALEYEEKKLLKCIPQEERGAAGIVGAHPKCFEIKID